MVVAVGETLVEPFADVEVKAAGVMAMLVAPVVAQLSVELKPDVMLAGFDVNELITGLFAPAFTVTVAVAVVEPALSVAVSVYVVVAVGLTLVEPLADVDVNVPGVIAMLAAPVVDQLRVALAPVFMPVGFAKNERMVGAEPFVVPEFDAPPQPISTAHAARTQADKMRPPRMRRKITLSVVLRWLLRASFAGETRSDAFGLLTHLLYLAIWHDCSSLWL